MAQSAEERRRAPRHSYACPVTYMGKVSTPGAPSQEVPFQGKIMDLSNGGSGMEERGDTFMESGAQGGNGGPMSSVRGEMAGLGPVKWVAGAGHGGRPDHGRWGLMEKTNPGA